MRLASVNEVTGTIAIRGALKNDRTFVRSHRITKTQNPNTSCNMTTSRRLQNAQLKRFRGPFQLVGRISSARSDVDGRHDSRLSCVTISQVKWFALTPSRLQPYQRLDSTSWPNHQRHDFLLSADNRYSRLHRVSLAVGSEESVYRSPHNRHRFLGRDGQSHC